VQQRVSVLAPQSAIAQAVIARIGQRGGTVACVGRDVSAVDESTCVWKAERDLVDFEAVESALLEAREQLGGITGLVNCAGSILLKPAYLTSRKEYDETVEANLTTAFATRAIAL
jgi:NAD(P)-dependent dehydrogenase (short-subunit alcohol dehydrogenase family)